MANLNPLQPNVAAAPAAKPAAAAAAEEIEAVVRVNEAGTAPYDTLIRSCTNRLNQYIRERPQTVRASFSAFFSKSRDFDNANLKEIEVKSVKELIGSWQPSNWVSTKQLLIDLSLIADKAQKGVFWPKWIKNSELLKAINDIKDMIWVYIIQNKPEVKEALVLNRQQMIASLNNDASGVIKNANADDVYEISAGVYKFKNKGEQLTYEIENMYPIGNSARNALLEKQRETHTHLNPPAPRAP